MPPTISSKTDKNRLVRRSLDMIWKLIADKVIYHYRPRWKNAIIPTDARIRAVAKHAFPRFCPASADAWASSSAGRALPGLRLQLPLKAR
jgi:hypothetical protein